VNGRSACSKRLAKHLVNFALDSVAAVAWRGCSEKKFLRLSARNMFVAVVYFHVVLSVNPKMKIAFGVRHFVAMVVL